MPGLRTLALVVIGGRLRDVFEGHPLAVDIETVEDEIDARLVGDLDAATLRVAVVQQAVACRQIEETVSQSLDGLLDGDPSRDKLAHKGVGVIGLVLAGLLFVFHVQP